MSKTAEGKDFLGKTIEIIIDRPLGSTHPKHDDMVYPVNYGFVPGTKAGDGMEIDVYYLSSNEPLTTVKGVCIGYVHRFDDNEDKLIASNGERFTIDQIEDKLNFQEKWFKHDIVLAREQQAHKSEGEK